MDLHFVGVRLYELRQDLGLRELRVAVVHHLEAKPLSLF
jgi:hypothetical protein